MIEIANRIFNLFQHCYTRKMYSWYIDITLVGCPDDKKRPFLEDLKKLMQEKMRAVTADFDETTAKWQRQTSKDEHVATWHFVMLDDNKNKV